MTTEKYSNLMKYLVLSESVATKIIVKLLFSNCFISKAYLIVQNLLQWEHTRNRVD